MIEFSTFKELGEMAGSLDKCLRTESHFKKSGVGAFVSDNKRRDIINLTTGDRTAVVSDIYQEYQHADVINHLVQSFTKAQLEGHGRLYDNGDTISVTLWFDNVKIIPDPNDYKYELNKQGILVGARFKNSYNKQNSVTGTGFMLRKACSNGMMVRAMIPELSFSERHTKSILTELPARVTDFIDNLLTRAHYVGEAAKAASEVTVAFATKEQRLQTMIALVDHKKVGELVEAQLDSLTPTKWDVYNAITAVASHEQMGETVRDKVERVSEKVLSQTYVIVPAVVA